MDGAWVHGRGVNRKSGLRFHGWTLYFSFVNMSESGWVDIMRAWAWVGIPYLSTGGRFFDKCLMLCNVNAFNLLYIPPTLSHPRIVYQTTLEASWSGF